MRPAVARRKLPGHRHITGREGCYRDRVLGAGWTEVVALVAAFAIAVLALVLIAGTLPGVLG
jgi:hypothetical protein